MLEKIKRLLLSEGVRYIFIGGCTTAVNFICYAVLCYLTPLGETDAGITVSNVVSVSAAIIFAYFANKIIVFRSKTETAKQLITEMAKFVGARLSTMAIEVAGVWLTVTVLGQNEMVGKLETQFLVLAGNYIISKFFVFTGRIKEKEAAKENE